MAPARAPRTSGRSRPTAARLSGMPVAIGARFGGGQRTSRLWKYIAITHAEESSSFPDAPACLGAENDALTDPNGLNSKK